jgi:hypothetical protein
MNIAGQSLRIRVITVNTIAVALPSRACSHHFTGGSSTENSVRPGASFASLIHDLICSVSASGSHAGRHPRRQLHRGSSATTRCP